MEDLLIFVLGLAIVTVVGHLIWVAIAAFFRVVIRTTASEPARPDPIDAELRWLRIAGRVVQEMLDRGEIDRATADRVARGLDARRHELRPVYATLVEEPPRPAVVSPPPLRPSAPVPFSETKPLPTARPAWPEQRIVPPTPAAPPPPPVSIAVELPPRPRRSLTSVLAAFMEERNILWGELTGGLLIVGCSIALVITLWHSLEDLPYFPFLIFACITAALFGAGEYTLHHWKLRSTSRGLLVISLLLVPLNLLVLADPSLGRSDSALEWIFKSAAVLLSVGMVRLAGRDLIGVDVLPGPIDRRWLFVLAVVGAAASQLVVPHRLDAEHPAVFVVLGCVPAACHLLACGAVVAGLARARARAADGRLEVWQVHSLFVFLGLSSFALFVALGFLLSRGEASIALPRWAVPFGLAGVPVLAGGLLVRRALDAVDAGPRTAGTAVALVGLGIMLSAVALAWPNPVAVLLVGLADGVLLSAIAFRWRLPRLHAAAVPCLALAVLVAVAIARGGNAVLRSLDADLWLASQLLAPSGGVALAVLMVLAATGAEALARIGRREDAAAYAFAAGGLAVAALLTTTCHGFWSPWPAALAYALSAASSLAMYVRWRRPALPYACLGLLVGDGLWVLGATVPGELVLWSFVLAVESAALAAAGGTHSFRRACRDVAAATAALALFLIVTSVGSPGPRPYTGTAAVLALTALLLARTFGRHELTWFGSALAFAALAHLFLVDLDVADVSRPLLAALLAHATLALLGGLALKARNIGGAVLHAPLSGSARLTSLVAVPLLLLPSIAAGPLAVYTFWLAGLWLTVAVARRSPPWFTAFQAALSAAVVFTVRAVLPRPDLLDPPSLQSYGVGLGLLGLGWVAARMALSSRPRMRELWQAKWPSLDRVVLGALVAGQFLLALVGIAPGVVAELTPDGFVALIDWPDSFALAYGSGAWLLLGVLALVLLASLRERGRASVVLGLLVLAATVPILAAGPFAAELATASALRWGLALCYLACSILLWVRRSLERATAPLGVAFATESPVVVAHAWLGVAAAAVLVLTAQVAILGFSGQRPAGPAAGSLFAEMGWILSNVGPLLLLTIALTGHAVRERAPGYAFAAGLLANVSITGGYALAVVTSGRHLGEPEIVRLWQLGSLTAALWALAWMLSLPWLYVWYGAREDSERAPSPAGVRLLMIQTGLALSGQVILLACAALLLSELPSRRAWVVAAAASPGWESLLASLAALVLWHRLRRRPTSWGWLFAGGLAAVVLLACTAEGTHPDTGYYVLLLGWPAYVLLWSLAPLVGKGLSRRAGPAPGPVWFSFADFGRLAPLVLLPCIPSVLLALQVAAARHEYLWAAGAVGACALAAALLAIGRRSPDLAFLAGLVTNLTVSLFVFHLHRPLMPSSLALVQANVLASAGGALVWLMLRRGLTSAPPGLLLAIQAQLGIALHTCVMLLPLLRIYTDPGRPPRAFIADFGSVAGWAALLLSATAAFADLAGRAPRGRIHVLGVAGLSAGALAAFTVSPWDSGGWLSYHVLLGAWCALGLLATAAGGVAFSFRLPNLLPTRQLRHWMEGIGLVVLVLVLPACWEDPLRPVVPAAAVLTVSLMAGTLAIWSRRPHYVWISGLLFNLIGLLFWSAWGSATATGFVLMNVLGLAIASAFWTTVELLLPTASGAEPARRPSRRIAGSSFAHVAALAALALLVLVVVLALVSDLYPPAPAVSLDLAWTAAAAVAAALIAALWDRRADFAPPGLYVLGLAMVGLVLHGLHRPPAALGWSAALLLANYTVCASLVARAFRRSGDPWFPPAQTAVAVVVVALSLWMDLGFAARADRLAGPAAVLLLVLANLAMIHRESGAKWLRPAALALGALAAAEIGWACPDPGGPAPWLHRNVLLMVAFASVTALYGVGLPRWLAHDDDWIRAARRAGPILGVLASLTLLLLLVQELHLYDATTRRAPMAWPAVVVVLVALLTLMVSGIRFAVVPGRDPLGLSERGRMLYVYAVELLLVLLFVHLRLTAPFLFHGWLNRYWTFVAMLIAFAGVGLSEHFERRKLRVLAEPLQRTGVFLPLLPLLAFFVRPLAPGLPPPVGALLRHNLSLHAYSLLWLMVCGLYSLVSLTRRSFVFAVLAALAANFALWSLLSQHGVAFLLHPQCWLIPLALIVLVSEHVNRDRLPSELAAALRYLGISMIYVSSTADLFIAGLGNSVALPVVLAVLSLAGVLTGILVRVRAFLFLGISFLFLDVFTMIWHAAVDRYQTWVWWVSGIVLGAAILTLFAVFEKRRNDVLHLLDEIKRWD